MSTAALAWALKQPIKPSSLKFLLVACADVTPEGGLTYPSVAHLASITCQDDKTVYKGLAELVKRGYLKDTGRKTGRTAQIPVYELVGFDNSPKNGSVVNKVNTPVPPVKDTRFSPETHPKTGHGTPMELQEERLTKTKTLPAGFEEFWNHFDNKVSRPDAEKAWRKLNPDSALQAAISLAIDAQDAERAAYDRAGQFYPEKPYPSTWLNKKRWTDAPKKAPRETRKPSASEQVRMDTHSRAIEDGRKQKLIP